MSNANDNRMTELREKLTERGIEYVADIASHDGVRTTHWKNDCNIVFQAIDCGMDDLLIQVALTPEQAIAATLGSFDDNYDEKNIEYILGKLGNELNPDGLPNGLTISKDSNLLNWRGENYVKQSTLGGGTANADDALSLLDEIREAGRISYDDYSQLFDAIADLGNDTLTAEQVSVYLKAMALDLQSPTPFKTLEEKQAIIKKYAHEIAELGGETCELEETESYSGADEVIHALECSACGRTCEHVNGSYPRCPHCGAKAVER